MGYWCVLHAFNLSVDFFIRGIAKLMNLSQIPKMLVAKKLVWLH